MVSKLIEVLHVELMKNCGSKLNVYNDWCTRVYTGYQNGIANAYSKFNYPDVR